MIKPDCTVEKKEMISFQLHVSRDKMNRVFDYFLTSKPVYTDETLQASRYSIALCIENAQKKYIT